MKKRLLVILIILIFIASAGIVYLNNVILPLKIKALIVKSLKEATGKQVSLESLKFNILKGLVLKDLVIYDKDEKIISIKELSCPAFLPPIFRKTVIIPSLRLKYPEISAERNKQGKFNLEDLFSNISAQANKAGFQIIVLKLTATNGVIHLKDNYLARPFVKDISDLNLKLYLSLPLSLKFILRSEIQDEPLVKIGGSGEYKIKENKLSVNTFFQNFPPAYLLAYFESTSLSMNSGLLNGQANLNLSDNILNLALAAESKGLRVVEDKISADLNLDAKVNLGYNLLNNLMNLEGRVIVSDSRIWGLKELGEVRAINGEFTFDNSGIKSDKLSASIWGFPVDARLNLKDFYNPLLSINIISRLKLAALQAVLKDKFKLIVPAEIIGDGRLSITAQTPIPAGASLQLEGSLDVKNALVKSGKLNSPFEDIKGRLEFGQDRLAWKELNFKYQDLLYKTSGTLDNFKLPQIQFKLNSKDLNLESALTIKDNLVEVSKCMGRYLNSDFSFAGALSISSPAEIDSDLSGKLSLNLSDTKVLFKKYEKDLNSVNPRGLLEAQFNLEGNILDFKSCLITAKILSPAFSAYGLNAQDMTLNYTQAGGVIDISGLHLSLYDGTIDGSAKMNLNTANLPYWINADMQGVRLEKLKLDTGAKKEDLSGVIKGQVKLNGFSNNLDLLNGSGNILINDGKLWQLNLFKGLGALLFARDFANITFKEGSCDFSVKDKSIFTDNLKLKSDISNLSGSVKIGFNQSIEASLDVQVLSDTAPLTGTFKDITTAIIGQSGRFGVIKISGTLKDPKYKFQTAVTNILKGLTNTFFNR